MATGASESEAGAGVLAGGGDMGALARTLDWASTPLGDPRSWPQSLRTVVSIVFESTFPMMLAWGPAFTQIYNVTPASALALADLSGIRVLLVDDDVDAAQMAKEVLVASGAGVTTAAAGDDALRLLAAQNFDVAILDIGMPVMDGYELLRRIREGGLGLNASIPAAALTAYARVSDRTRSLQAGFQMHLGKPIEPAELAAAVHSMARPHRARKPPTIERDDAN